MSKTTDILAFLFDEFYFLEMGFRKGVWVSMCVRMCTIILNNDLIMNDLFMPTIGVDEIIKLASKD